MPLPTGDIEWPPAPHRGIKADHREWAAWYSGSPDELGNVYGSQGEQSTVRRNERDYGPLRRMFWGRRGETAPLGRTRLHIPVASDIALTSADLLFGSAPEVKIREAHVENAAADATTAQDRLVEIMDTIGFENLILEAAEVGAALGGVFLVPGWDAELINVPTLDVVHADAAVPDWRGSVLQAVTFWKVVHRDAQVVWRHLERHEDGRIINGLYVGNPTNLGTSVPLERHPATADLPEEIVIPELVLNGRPHIVQYVPNVKPHRKFRHLPIGRADFAGVEGLMDALDETYTSWMRDVRLGQARLVVSEDALTRRGRGMGATFDADQEVFTPIAMEPSAKDKGGVPIDQVQFEIRTQQHMDTCLHLFERIVSSAGYSPQTFGLRIDGSAESGTALRVREGKTLKTRERKGRYWAPALEAALRSMLAIDVEIFGQRDHGVFRPSVDLADVIVNNPVEVGQSISLFRSAQAISIETGVRMAQPDLDKAGIDAEVERIKEEQGTTVGDPTGGFLG